MYLIVFNISRDVPPNASTKPKKSTYQQQKHVLYIIKQINKKKRNINGKGTKLVLQRIY